MCPWIDINNQFTVHKSVSERIYRIFMMRKKETNQLAVRVVAINLQKQRVSFELEKEDISHKKDPLSALIEEYQ